MIYIVYFLEILILKLLILIILILELINYLVLLNKDHIKINVFINKIFKLIIKYLIKKIKFIFNPIFINHCLCIKLRNFLKAKIKLLIIEVKKNQKIYQFIKFTKKNKISTLTLQDLHIAQLKEK
jgi:hypothetical protein